MKLKTRHMYQRRIRELKKIQKDQDAEFYKLMAYKTIAKDIFSCAAECASENKVLSNTWVLKKFLPVML